VVAGAVTKTIFQEQESQQERKAGTEAVPARLPHEVVRFIDLGIAKGIWESRSEAVRMLVLAGINSPEVQALGIEENPSVASSLSLLGKLALEKAVHQGVSGQLLLLEEPLRKALQAGTEGREEAKQILAAIAEALQHLPPFWRKIAEGFLHQSPVFRLAIERYGEPELWRGAP